MLVMVAVLLVDVGVKEEDTLPMVTPTQTITITATATATTIRAVVGMRNAGGVVVVPKVVAAEAVLPCKPPLPLVVDRRFNNRRKHSNNHLRTNVVPWKKLNY